MVNNFKTREAVKTMKEQADRYLQSFEIRRRNSEEEYKKTLKPGERFFVVPGFYDENSRLAFEADCEDIRQKVHAALDSVSREIMEKATAAPSTEAVNTIALLANRNAVSEDELDMYMTKYGKDCPLAYKSLKEIAEKHGYYDFEDNDIDLQAENIQILSNSIDRTFISDRSQDTVTTAIAGFCSNVDQAFPEE